MSELIVSFTWCCLFYIRLHVVCGAFKGLNDLLEKVVFGYKCSYCALVI